MEEGDDSVNIEYAYSKSYWQAVQTALVDNVFLHADLINVNRNHSMFEYQDRMQRIVSNSEDEACSSLATLTMEDLCAWSLELQKAKDWNKLTMS